MVVYALEHEEPDGVKSEKCRQEYDIDSNEYVELGSILWVGKV